MDWLWISRNYLNGRIVEDMPRLRLFINNLQYYETMAWTNGMLVFYKALKWILFDIQSIVAYKSVLIAV